MSQPIWKRLWSTDDTQLFVDTTGVYAPEIEVAEEIFDSATVSECPDCNGAGDDCDNVDCVAGEIDSGNRFQVFRISCERFKKEGTYLVPERWESGWWRHSIKDYEPWFAKDLGAVATFSAVGVDDLIGFLCSADPSDLASAYMAIAGYFGCHEFDSYPLDLSEKEVNARWHSKD